MRIGTKLIHNLDNEKIVIMDESTQTEITFTPEEYKALLTSGCTILHDHRNVSPTLLTTEK